MIQRLGSSLVTHNGVTLAMYLEKLGLSTPDTDPYHFGAKGDGVTDDSDAIQAMFNSRNSAPVLADNFWGAFTFRRQNEKNKFLITKEIKCGRPIKVDALGAEFIINSSITAFNFSMHNGVWMGGYINYTNVLNANLDEGAIAIRLATETSPIMFMASTLSHLRVWGAHSGIVFENPNTEIWGVKIEQCQLQVRPGVSTSKARGVHLNSVGGAGGSTTVRLSEVSVAYWGTDKGVGLKAYLVNVNDVIFDNCAYDGLYDAVLRGCKVGGKDVMDVTSFRCEVRGFHTEALINDSGQWDYAPFHFNTNSLTLDGMEHLLTQHTNHNGWVTLAGDGIAKIGAWHDLPQSGTGAKDAAINLAFAPADLVVVVTGNLTPSDFVGGKLRNKVYFPSGASPYGVDSDVTVTMDNTNPKKIMTLPTGVRSLRVSVEGANTSSEDLGWTSDLLLLRVPTGGWVLDPRTLKLPNFQAATVTYSVTTNDELMLFNNSTNTYRVQCKIEPGMRGSLSGY